jgi:hypothetical protein
MGFNVNLELIARDYFEGGGYVSELRDEKEILADILNRIMRTVNSISEDLILVDEDGAVLTDEGGNVLINEV